MQETILCYGQPPLTAEAADAALDLIHFIATAVWGVDGIHVTNAVRPLWRSHLAAWFLQLPPETQAWYANAPMILTNVSSQWGMLNPWQRGAMVQQWAMELPSMLWMLEPVLAQAHQEEMQEHVRGQIAEWRQQAAQAPQAQQVQNMSSAEAIQELQRRSQQATQLANFNTNMTNWTINMIRSK